jgi:hypothetical protein
VTERPWWLDDRRWAVAGVIALIASGVSAVGGRWAEAALFLVAALALAAASFRTMRR